MSGIKFGSSLKFTFLLLVVGFVLGSVYGFLSYRLKIPPYTIFMKTYLSALEVRDRYTGQRDVNVPKQVSKEDIEQILQIRDFISAEEKRLELMEVLWGERKLPNTAGLSFRENIQTDRYSNLVALASADSLTVTMEFGIESNLHLFHPVEPNGELVIYHQGHLGDFIEGNWLIDRLLKSGFSVVGASMPLLGLNNKPEVDLSGQGVRALMAHNQLPFLAVEDGIAVKFFVEPIVVLLNYLSLEKSFSKFHMVGISGGGWTATMVAAVDDRIEHSFSVAGTEPLVFSSEMPTEYEQIAPELYTRVSYFDLYLLSSFGQGRSHMQVHNLYDPCCNRGENTALFEEGLQRRLLEIGGGGRFGVIVDDTHAEHKISDRTADYIIDALMSGFSDQWPEDLKR